MPAGQPTFAVSRHSVGIRVQGAKEVRCGCNESSPMVRGTPADGVDVASATTTRTGAYITDRATLERI